jgi:hypothetical protein
MDSATTYQKPAFCALYTRATIEENIMPYSDIWKPSEIFAAVKLALFLRDNPTAVKSELMNELTVQLDRVDPEKADYVNARLAAGLTIGAKAKIKGPVERKVWNVSAILIDAGMAEISGFNYFGGFNYQFAEVDAVAVALKIKTATLLRRVNKGRAAYGERGAAGEFTKSVNAKLIDRARNPITPDHMSATLEELDKAEKENRPAHRSTQLRTEV